MTHKTTEKEFLRILIKRLDESDSRTMILLIIVMLEARIQELQQENDPRYDAQNRYADEDSILE